MSADVVQIRPKASETFVCPCGSMWFAIQRRFSTEGRVIETKPVAECIDCGRKHHYESKRPE